MLPRRDSSLLQSWKQSLMINDRSDLVCMIISSAPKNPSMVFLTISNTILMPGSTDMLRKIRYEYQAISEPGFNKIHAWGLDETTVSGMTGIIDLPSTYVGTR